MDDAFNQTLFLLLPTSLVGVIVNTLVFYSFLRLNIMKHSFGYLSASQALADAIHCAGFLMYFCPMVLFNNKLMKTYSNSCALLVITCYELSLATHFIISLNRCCAVWSPFKYPNIFNTKNTFWIIALLWIVYGFIDFVFFTSVCPFLYSDELNWIDFVDGEKCIPISWFQDFIKSVTIITIFMLIDVATLLRVRNSRLSNDTTSNNKVVSERERRFLTQTVSQGTSFTIEAFLYYMTPYVTEDPLALWLALCYAFLAVHALDGMIVIMCNPDIRACILCRKQVRKVSIVQSSRVTNF